MINEDLYSKLVCALTHDMRVCDNCKQCAGKDFAEIRMNLVRDVAEYMGKGLPWNEDNEER